MRVHWLSILQDTNKPLKLAFLSILQYNMNVSVLTTQHLDSSLEV